MSDVDTAIAVGEPCVRVRAGAVEVPRLVRAEPGNAARWQNAGTVLITGGTGGIGALMAQRLVREHGVGKLVLTSRRGAHAPGAAELVTSLTDLGAEATAVACDVGDRDAVAALVAEIPDLTGVIHAAGVLDDGLVTGLTPARIDGVLAPKADAAQYLHELTRDRPLTEFVLVSSVAGVVATPGQGNYAAANAYLDALAVARHAEGLPARSLAYGLWDPEVGLGGGQDRVQIERMRRDGFDVLSAEEGLGLFDLADGPAVAAVKLHLPGLREQAKAGRLPELLTGVVRVAVRRTAQSAAEETGLAALTALPPARRGAAVVELVREHTAAVLDFASAGEVDEGRPFTELGFDSLMSVELRNRLAKVMERPLGATVVFDHPTPTALALHLRQLAFPGDDRPEPDENQLRRALATVSLDRLRELGVLESLLVLAAEEPAEPREPEPDSSEQDDIDELGVNDLISRVMSGSGE